MLTRVSPTVASCILAFGLYVSLGQAHAAEPQMTLPVNCNVNGSLSRALQVPAPGLRKVLVLTGTCTEDIEVTSDDVTLRAATLGNAAIQATVNLRGARRAIIENLILTSVAPDTSTLILWEGSSATIRNNRVENGTRNGISLNESSFARIHDNEVRGNFLHGVVVGNGSSAVVHQNSITENRLDGILVLLTSAATVQGNTIVNNGRRGVTVQATSSTEFRLRVAPPSGPANFIQGNSGGGVGCFSNSTLDVGANQNFGTGNGSSGTSNFQNSSDCRLALGSGVTFP